jgi:hypothetical protein
MTADTPLYAGLQQRRGEGLCGVQRQDTETTVTFSNGVSLIVGANTMGVAISTGSNEEGEEDDGD